MESVDERFNRLKAGIQAREESVTQRYNDIVNRMNTQQQLAQRRANVNPMNSIRNQYSVFKQRLPEIRKQTEYNKANAKRLQEEQTAKNLGMSYEDFKKAEEQRKAVATNAMKDGKKPNYNLPQLSVSNEEKKDKRDNGQYSLTDLSYDIAYSDWNKTPYGKIARVGIDAINNAGTIADSAVRGADNGGADFLSYATRLTKKKDEMLNNAGTWGKVLAVATGDTEYLFNNDTKREAETREILNSLERFKNNNNEQIDYNRKIVDQNSTTGIVKKVNELAPSIGNNAVGAGLSMISPTAGTMYFIGSAGGSYYDDAIRRGMNEDQALLYGTVMGTMEGLTEKVALGKTTKAGMMLGKGELGKALTETGISLGENFIQEAIMEPIQETSAMVIGGKDKSDFSNMGQRMLQSGIDGALSAILMEGATAGVQSAVNVQDKIERGQNVSDKEIQQALFDVQASKKVDIEAKFKQEIQYQVQKASREYAKKNNIENLQQNPIKNQNINQQQQISQVDTKNGLNQNVEGRFIDNYIKSAQQNNIDTNNRAVGQIGELSAKRGVQTLFDGSYFKNNSNANAMYITDENGNRSIILNPNAKVTNKTLQQVEIHELVHDMYQSEGFERVRDMVLEYDKGKEGYAEARKALEDLYAQVYDRNAENFSALVDEEAVADILGNKLGDQQFINELVNQKETRSKARQIYDWIVEKLNNITRSFENINDYFFWKDVKNKFEVAFQQEYHGNNQDTRYSIIEIVGKNKNYGTGVLLDTDLFEGLKPRNWENKLKQYVFENLAGKEIPTIDENGNVRNVYVAESNDRVKKDGSKNSHKVLNKLAGSNKNNNIKNLSVAQLEEVVQSSKKIDENTIHNHQWLDENGWEFRKTYLQDVKGNIYEAVLNVAKGKTRDIIYDINNIREVEHGNASSKGQSKRTTSLINDSILQNEQNVKLSMQEANNINLPKTDNKGNMLSKQQQEYFKDSKVRDENGNLKVVYHGTINAGFTEFNRNFNFFTDNQDVAKTYTGNDGGVYEGYVNISNPITIEANGEKWSMIDVNNISIDGIDNVKGFLDEYGASTWQEKGKIRTSTADLISAISDAIDDGKINSDGVIIKNIYDEGAYSDSSGKKLGNDYVTFKSNQFKNKSNSNPTTKSDMRYSKSEDTSNKTLLALHNLSEDKLKGILELGGFPVPSIAITNPDIVDHGQFGDISVVFDKDTIDPANSQNEVYDRDVWSPTFPQVDYVINQDAIDTVSKNIGIEWWRLNDYAEDSKPNYLIEKLARNEDVIDKYIKDNNLKYEVAYKEPSFKRSYNNTEEMKKWANKNNPTLEELSTNQKLKEEYLKLTQLDKNSELYETLDSSLDWYSKDHIKNPWLTQLENDLNILTGKAEIQPEIDEYTTRDNKERVAKQNGLEKYLKENIKDIYGERGIRNDRDIFTPSGNRRSFWQLHDEYNLENIVRNLVSQDTTGSENSLFTGFGKINAQMSNKFNSIEDIKNNQNRLMQDTENNNLEAYKETILEDVNELADYYKYPDSGFGMQGYENASESIFELAKSKKLTVENFKKILTENVMNTEKIPDSLLNKVIDDLDNLKNLPTDYFEAKPQRAVGLDEVKAIVVPNNMNQELKQQLIDRGLNVVEYDANKEGDRQAKIKALDEYKFSKTTDGKWQNRLDTVYKNKNKGTYLQDIKLPTKENIQKYSISNQDSTNLPTGKNVKEATNKADINLPPKISANNQYKDTTTKVRKHYKSIIESANTTPEAKTIAKELMGTDTYIPETNKSELERADEKIMNSTPESELNSLMSRATIGEKITPVDIAVGERLIEYYSKIGDKAKLQDAIQATAMAGTTAGQTVQAMSLLNHMTPQGQAVWLQRSVDKMNNKLKKTRGKNAQQFTLTDDMLQKIVSSENEEQLTKNLDDVYKELGQQVSKSTMEKIDAWRYFSMLANPRTHIRNILGNFAMARVQVLKNKVAGVTEAVVSKANKNMERTHTIVPASKEVRQFAKADIKNVTDRLGLTEGKLNPQTRLENNMKTFKHDAMNKTVGKLFDLNNKALEVEDGWGLKAGYAKALAEYMTANKLKPDTITDAQLSKARNYAVQQAKEATFHQENQLASLVNQLSNRNRFAKFGVDAVLPFKKTPMNIAKTGIEYSPVGLAKSMVLDTVQLRKGNITVNQYIDNISKGLTGTGITLVGYALAQAGILKASGGDDDKEKYEEGRGKQAFSIQIGDNTYSLDWLAPTAIPLFIGAEISALNKATNETQTSNASDENSKYNQLLKSTTNVLDAFTNSMNPMMEMSMLSGLASTLRSYEQGATQGITAMGTNALKSYVNQFFPTAMGQVAKTMDPYERSTTSTKSGMLPKAVDSTKNQIMAKVPGLRQMLPTKTDVWGNEMKQPENVVQRALENAVLPYTRKEVNNNDVDQELVRLYEERGEKAVLPSSSLSKDLTFSGEKYKMTSEEFAKYKKDYGSKSYSLVNDLVNSSDYNRLSDEDKQQALENVYKYAKEYAKDQYAKANDIDYKKDTMFKTAQELEKSGNISSYFNYLAKTDGMKEKEKMNVLVKASYDNNNKKLIYSNTIGSDDKLYNDAMKYTGININEYLKYKQQEFTSDKTDDGTENGKSVSGSKKAKVYDYVNKMKITGEQRMLLLGTQYKLTNAERATLANYVKNLKITKNEKLQIYKKLQGFTVYKDGRVTY